MPRLRIDHLLDFNWKFLVPLSLVNLVVMSLVEKALSSMYWDVDKFPRAVILFAVNLLIIVGTYLVLGAYGRRVREREEALREELQPVVSGVQG